MPDECTWASFFKPCDILRELELGDEISGDPLELRSFNPKRSANGDKAEARAVY